MDDISKNTYNEVQATLLNSEQDPRREVVSALYAVLEFAQKEGSGMTKPQMRRLCEEVLSRLEDDPEVPPECFGVSHSKIDILCTGGKDPSYKYQDSPGVRPQCIFFVQCGEALANRNKSATIPAKALRKERR